MNAIDNVVPNKLAEALVTLTGIKSSCYKIGHGYFSDVYAWNGNYNYIIKWYNDNVNETGDIEHLPDHVVLSKLQHLKMVPRLVSYSKDYCVMSRVPGNTLDCFGCDLLYRYRDRIISAVSTVASEALHAGFIVNDLNLGNVIIDVPNDNIYVIDYNLYLEKEHRAEAFKSFNAATNIFDDKGVDVLSEEAVRIFIENVIDMFTHMLDKKIGGYQA